MPTAVANGKRFKFPEGTTKAQMDEAIDSYFAPKAAPAPDSTGPAPTSDEALRAHGAERGNTLSSMLGTAFNTLSEYAPATQYAGALEKLMPGTFGGARTAVRDTLAGLGGGEANVIEGARQAFNKLTGDEEELGQLNADTELRRRKLAELTKESPTLASLGETAGEAAPALLVPGSSPAALGRLGRTALGAGAGLAQGFASALTPEEEASGDRATRAKWGAALGGFGGLVAPRAAQLNQDLRESGKKMLPEDALDDFLSRTTGKTGDVTGTYGDIVGGVKNKIAEHTDKLDTMYENVDTVLWDSVGRPTVPTKADSLLNNSNLTASTVESLTSQPAIRDVMNATALGTGVEYPTYAKAIRELNDIGNDPKTNAGTARIAQSLGAEFRQHLDDLGSADDAINVMNNGRKLVSEEFASKVVPMREAGVGAPIGTWQSGGATEKDFADIFLSGKSGRQLQDLFERAPEVKGDVRKYFGSVVGAQPEVRRALGSSSTRDVLFDSPAEREYATKLSRALRGGADDETATAATKMVNRLGGKYSPILNLFRSEKQARGVLPYGMNAKTFNKAEKTAQALRASILLEAMQRQDEVRPLED